MAGGLSLRRYEIEGCGDRVVVYFFFEAGLERRWEPRQAERLFKLYGIADTEEGNVEIDFAHWPAEPEYGLPARTYFIFYSNVSGNPLYNGVGMAITERIGRFFGV